MQNSTVHRQFDGIEIVRDASLRCTEHVTFDIVHACCGDYKSNSHVQYAVDLSICG